MTRASTSILLLASLEDSDRKGGGLSDRRLFDVRDGSCGEPRQISLEIAGEEKKNEGEKGREMKNVRKNGKAVLGNK